MKSRELQVLEDRPSLEAAGQAAGRAAEQAAGQGLLIGLAGMYQYATIQLRPGESIVLGRDAGLSHLVIDRGAEKISRRHCEVMLFTDRPVFRVTDFSSNGTFLSTGQRLKLHKPSIVKPGSELCLGSTENRFLLTVEPLIRTEKTFGSIQFRADSQRRADAWH